jgi:hypothetical protein
MVGADVRKMTRLVLESRQHRACLARIYEEVDAPDASG